MYDLICIGGGPGGYTAAINGAQQGLKVALINRYKNLGGTCLNVGCIPTKTLLDISESYDIINKLNTLHKIIDKKINIIFKNLIKRKNEIINKLLTGINYLIKKNKIDIYYGIAEFITKNKIKIINNNNSKYILGNNIIIATGSKPNKINFKSDKILYSNDILSLKYLPKKITIIGGGIISLELGTFYNRLGSDVTILESNKTLINNMDIDIIKYITNKLKKSYVKVICNTKIISIKDKNNKIIITFLNKKEKKKIKSDNCLVSIGRYPYTKDLNLDKIGIKKDKNGFIYVNKKLQTNINNIYAIGDVNSNIMLAHKASEEAILVTNYIVNNKNNIKINYNAIPNIIYIHPEIASVGYTEQYCINNNIKFKKSIYPVSYLGRAHIIDDSDGFVKIIINNNNKIIGMHIISPRASDLIIIGVSSIINNKSINFLCNIYYPHPTFSESIKEASMMLNFNRTINF